MTQLAAYADAAVGRVGCLRGQRRGPLDYPPAGCSFRIGGTLGRLAMLNHGRAITGGRLVALWLLPMERALERGSWIWRVHRYRHFAANVGPRRRSVDARRTFVHRSNGGR